MKGNDPMVTMLALAFGHFSLLLSLPLCFYLVATLSLIIILNTTFIQTLSVVSVRRHPLINGVRLLLPYLYHSSSATDHPSALVCSEEAQRTWRINLIMAHFPDDSSFSLSQPQYRNSAISHPTNNRVSRFSSLQSVWNSTDSFDAFSTNAKALWRFFPPSGLPYP